MATTPTKNPIVDTSTSSPQTTSYPKTSSSGQNDVVTNTTTVNPDSIGEVLTGANYIPYMREIDIDFVGMRLRPYRQLWFFFDDVAVNQFVQRPNIIESSSYDPNTLRGIDTGDPEKIQIGNSSAKVLLTETYYNNGEELTRIYTSHFTTTLDGETIDNGAYIQTLNAKSSYYLTVVKYQHNSGVLGELSNTNYLILASDANSTINNYYVGNTITIVKGDAAGQSGEIVSYDAGTREAKVVPEFSIMSTNSIYSIGDSKSSFSANSTQQCFASPEGYICGTLHIPSPSKNDVVFNTGDRIFRIIDNARDDTSSYTCRADYRFVSNGLDMSKAQIIERVITSYDESVTDTKPSVTPTPTKTNTPTPTRTYTPTGTKPVSVPAVSPSTSKAPTPTPTRDPCKPNIDDCRLRMDGGCFEANGSGEVIEGTTVKSGFLHLQCAPRWRYVESNGTIIKTFPNRLYTDSSITVDAVDLKVPGAVNYSSYQWTVGYHPDGDTLSDTLLTGSDTIFPDETYMQYWSPDTNGWGDTINVSGKRPSEIFCRINQCQPKNQEPTAQSFYVATAEHKDGVFVSSIDLYFRNKGTLPVELQLRPMVNGYPSSNTVIPGAVVVLESSQINTSEYPIADDDNNKTRFTFPSPVYLNSGFDYCFVVISDDAGYDYFCAELGKQVLGSDRLISKQAYSGSVFKSENGRTWTAIQDQDMMFQINQCNFNPTSGTLMLMEDKDKNQAVSTTNAVFDYFSYQADAIELPSAGLKWYFKSTSNATGEIDTTYTSFKPDSKTDLVERKVLTAPDQDQSLIIRADLSTSNPEVSPVIYHNRQNFVAVENDINNTGLSSSVFVITNPGSGYVSNAKVTITSSVGYGANAYAEINNSGEVIGIVVDNEGTGYVDDVTVTIEGGATATVVTETNKSGGPSRTRYISKVVSLLDGFDAGDLRLFLTAIKPPGSNVQVYYKVRNYSDTETIEQRNWVRMVQKTSEFIYSADNQRIEFEYRPSLTSNNIVYSTSTNTFKTFNQFMIKIVLSSDGTVVTKQPFVYDVRAIALPEDAY